MRTPVLVLGALALSVAGCHRNDAANVDGTGEPATLTSAPRPDSPTVKAQMHDHDRHGNAMRDGVARSDLDAARSEARILAALRVEGGVEPTWRKSLEAMNVAAMRVAKAKDLDEASRGLAAVAQTCGDCHAILGGPGRIVTEPPHPSPELVPRMHMHQWAAERMWEGLVIPSKEAWQDGARVLVDAPLEPWRLTPGQSPVPPIEELARSVHELGRKARVVEAAVDRDAIYGELMATCATCHVRLGGGPHAQRQP